MSKRALLTAVVVLFIVSLISVGFWASGGINLKAIDPPISSGDSIARATEEAIISEASARGIIASPQFGSLMGGESPWSCFGKDKYDKYDIDVDKVLKFLLPLLGVDGSRDEGCYELDIDITIKATVYIMNISSAILIVRPEGEITIKYYMVNKQGNCVPVEYIITLDPGKTEFAFKINNDLSLGDIVPLPRGKPCLAIKLPSIHIKEKIGELDREICPKCKDIGLGEV